MTRRMIRPAAGPVARADEPAARRAAAAPPEVVAPVLHLVPPPVSVGEVVVDEDVAAVAAFQDKAVAQNARRTYASGWRRFESWCREKDRVALPASPETVARFVAALARERGPDGEFAVKATTIGTWCAAIGAIHSRHGYTDPAADPAVRRTLRGIRVTRTDAGETPDRAAPIMLTDLTRILTAIDDHARTWRAQVAARRDTALLLAAFAGARRRSEVVGLQVRDIARETDDDGTRIRIALRGTKTRRTEVTWFVLEPGAHPRSCPCCALLAWLTLLADHDHAAHTGGPDAGVIAVRKRLRAERDHDPEEHSCARELPRFPSTRTAVFRPLGRSGIPSDATALTGQAFGRMVRARALAAGYSDEQAAAFRGHSLRAGATTQALDNGASYREVMNLTGHTQIDTVRGYDCAPTHRANATRKLGL
ncbi:tyrosine-type recombinase/integrase [Nocardia takedensis]|uniref:tyrosine-type recombinase/integrase n=1 Tax=Nocardia takedensis TaxID=259390 RepID=UPI00031ADB93|nr:tyrosine-type recombinase/integrase [Nocardia takedensis]